MGLAIVDPTIFCTKNPIPVDHMHELISIMVKYGYYIPDEWWKELIADFVKPFVASFPELKDVVFGFNQLIAREKLPRIAGHYAVWGFQNLFGHLGQEWSNKAIQITIRSVQKDPNTIILTRLTPGRNISGNNKLIWDLRIKTNGAPVWRINCICCKRNIVNPCTCRLPESLPLKADNAEFPFCVHPDWQKASTILTGTATGGKTGFVDTHGNCWVEPRIQPSYHYDVFLSGPNQSSYGLAQINITKWGVPPAQGLPGDLHHVPKGKKSRLRSTKGWRC
jgi:hypothetical protein